MVELLNFHPPDNCYDNYMIVSFLTLKLTVLLDFERYHYRIYSTDISTLDILVYLKPFLSVIRSEETSGPITGVALSSIDKFLNVLISKYSRHFIDRVVCAINRSATVD